MLQVRKLRHREGTLTKVTELLVPGEVDSNANCLQTPRPEPGLGATSQHSTLLLLPKQPHLPGGVPPSQATSYATCDPTYNPINIYQCNESLVPGLNDTPFRPTRPGLYTCSSLEGIIFTVFHHLGWGHSSRSRSLPFQDHLHLLPILPPLPMPGALPISLQKHTPPHDVTSSFPCCSLGWTLRSPDLSPHLHKLPGIPKSCLSHNMSSQLQEDCPLPSL